MLLIFINRSPHMNAESVGMRQKFGYGSYWSFWPITFEVALVAYGWISSGIIRQWFRKLLHCILVCGGSCQWRGGSFCSLADGFLPVLFLNVSARGKHFTLNVKGADTWHFPSTVMTTCLDMTAIIGRPSAGLRIKWIQDASNIAICSFGWTSPLNTWLWWLTTEPCVCCPN